MKTAKQIELLNKENAEKCLALFPEFDTISITMGELLNIIHKYFHTEHYTLNLIPFLPTARISLNNWDILYSLDENWEKEGYRLYCTFLQDEDYVCQCALTVGCFYCADVTSDIEFGVGEYYDSKYAIMQKQGYRKRELDSYVSGQIESLRPVIFTAVPFIFAAVNVVSENRETYTPVSLPNEPVANAGNRKDNKRESNGHGKKTVKLGGFLITTGDVKLQRAVSGRKNRRLAGSWSVRGHYRHYKDGKAVYIRPYEKGTGKKSTKLYILGENTGGEKDGENGNILPAMRDEA